MAVYECDFGRHRYPQPQQSIYYTHVISRVLDNYKMRLCPSHFRESCIAISEAMSHIEDSSAVSTSCDFCHKEAVGALYAKVFPSKLEPVDWVSDRCAEHLSTLANSLRIFNGEQRSKGDRDLP